MTRRGAGLHWSDVDLDAKRLVVRAALQRIKGEGLRMVETKTARGRRVVTMPAVCVAALRAHKVRQIQDRLLAGSRWVETDFVFTSGIDTPLDVEAAGRKLRTLLLDAGRPVRHPVP